MSQEVYELSRGLERIKSRIREIITEGSKPTTIGVAGGSGSGKTSKVAKAIKEMFPGSEVLSMDEYICSREEMLASIGFENWDDPRVYDFNLLRNQLKFHQQHLSFQKPIHSFKEAKCIGYESFGPFNLLILEGLFALYPGIVEELNLKIFVDIAVHGSLIRRILRDVDRTGQTEEDILEQYIKTVYPMFKLHIEPTKALADIVIVNQYVPELETEDCESREIQIKAILTESISREKLRNFGFEMTGSVFQTDIYYLAPNWGKGYFQELMRIRQEPGRYLLAYKGPHRSGLTGVRPKIEFEVKSHLKDALMTLGYRAVHLPGKKREKFLGHGLELVVDEFENGQCFLEFRTPDPKGEPQILVWLEKLGLGKSSITKKSYLELMTDLNQ